MELKDILNSINYTKQNLLENDPKLENLYRNFIVNRCLSYFTDTILAVNEVNQIAHADSKMQYDYLLHAIRPKKRFAPWQSKVEDEKIELIKQAYGISERKAIELAVLIDDKKLDKIKQSQFTGGHK